MQRCLYLISSNGGTGVRCISMELPVTRQQRKTIIFFKWWTDVSIMNILISFAAVKIALCPCSSVTIRNMMKIVLGVKCLVTRVVLYA